MDAEAGGREGENRTAHIAYLLGDPVAHSRSPLIHNAAFRAAGIDAAYRAVRVEAEALGGAVAGLRAPNVLGANVTIPHKQAVLSHLDALTPEAEAIGAVNTVVRAPDGTLCGDNTDAAGFLRGLDARALHDAPALVFGAGGAARAVVYALLTALRPETLTLVARRPAQAEALAADLDAFDPDGALRVVPVGEAAGAVRSSRLVVNTTPLGMHPDERSTPWPNASDFGSGHTVYDLVYTPQRTRLLDDANSRGAQTVGGLTMLVGQAAAAFVQWTGQPMPLAAVHAALARHTTPP